MTRRSPGEGSVVHRNDGRWMAALQVQGVRRTAYARTRREAVRRLEELKDEARATGTLPHPQGRTLDDLLDAWLGVLKVRPITLEGYRSTVDLHIRPALGRTPLTQVTPEAVERLCADLSPRTALKVFRAVSQALDKGVVWGWLARNVCDRLDPPRYRPPRQDPWTVEELTTFLEGTRGHRLYGLWLLAAHTGARIGELLALTWEDLDGERIHIRRTLQRLAGEWVASDPKTSSGQRTVAVPRWVLETLGSGEGLVFTDTRGGPLHAPTVAHEMREECDRLGLRPQTPHQLRHWSASFLLSQGVPLPDVSRRLGHADPSVTAKVYSHALNDDDGAVRVLEGLG